MCTVNRTMSPTPNTAQCTHQTRANYCAVTKSKITTTVFKFTSVNCQIPSSVRVDVEMVDRRTTVASWMNITIRTKCSKANCCVKPGPH